MKVKIQKNICNFFFTTRNTTW